MFSARYGVLFVPPLKAPKLGSWQWKEADAVENVVKHPFSGQPGIKWAINVPLSSEKIFGTSSHCIQMPLHARSSLCILVLIGITPDEMKAYFAMCVLMSQVMKSSIQSYWSQRSVISTPFLLLWCPGSIVGHYQSIFISATTPFLKEITSCGSIGLCSSTYWSASVQPTNPKRVWQLTKALWSFMGRSPMSSYIPLNERYLALNSTNSASLQVATVRSSLFTLKKVRRLPLQLGYCAVKLLLSSWTTGTHLWFCSIAWIESCGHSSLTLQGHA